MSSQWMLFLLRSIALGIIALLLSACGAVPPATPTGLPTLAGEAAVQTLTKAPWKLVTIQEGKSLPSARLKAGIPANHMRLTLTPRELSFMGGCNRTSGKVRLGAQGEFKAQDFVSTEMACDPELMLADSEMVEYLAATTLYEVTNKRLKLMGSTATLSFVTASLAP